MPDTPQQPPQAKAPKRQSHLGMWVLGFVMLVLFLALVGVAIFLVQDASDAQIASGDAQARISELEQDLADAQAELEGLTKDDEELQSTPTISSNILTRYRELVSSEIRVGGSEGSLGETYITQSFLDDFLDNPSCETLIGAEAGEYALPWILNESTRCNVIQERSDIYVTIVGLAWVYEGLPMFSDGIIYFKGGDPYLFIGVHPYLGSWKSDSFLPPLQQEFPDHDFGSDDFDRIADEYVEAMNGYLAEQEGEMEWAEEQLQLLVQLYF